uniref:DEP domain-containing protein n=1 Tax=Gopherus agassizii TaxID=38772 RepID=A0A452GNC4_9SAUR
MYKKHLLGLLSKWWVGFCSCHSSDNEAPPLLRLHEEKVIKDRRHHLKTYPNCFVAKELIDWLIDRKEASDRETAIKLVQKLLDRSIIHHGKMMELCHWITR